MDSILDRAAGALARHPAPALPLAELTRILRDDMPGVAVGKDTVLRALAQSPRRFRVLRATQGRKSLLAMMPDSEPQGGDPATGTALARLAAGPWVIGLGGGEAARPAGLAVLRASLTYLGQRLDEDSARDVARWMGLISECEQLADRTRRIAPSGGNGHRRTKESDHQPSST